MNNAYKMNSVLTPTLVGASKEEIKAPKLTYGKYAKFVEVQNKMDKILNGLLWTALPYSFGMVAVALFVPDIPYFRTFNDIIFAAIILVFAYAMLMNVALYSSKEDLLKAGHIQGFFDDGGSVGVTTVSKGLPTRKLTVTPIGRVPHYKAKNQEVTFNGEVMKVDIYFTEEGLNPIYAYQSTLILIHGRPTLFVEGKIAA